MGPGLRRGDEARHWHGEIGLQTHGMTRYLASRFAGMVIVMLLVATLVFFITRLAPGDPAAVMLGDQATAADIAKLRTSYGLDKPLPLQFAYWLGELAHGNLGESIFLQRPVTQALHYTWNTLKHGYRLGMGQHLPDRLYWGRMSDRPRGA